MAEAPGKAQVLAYVLCNQNGHALEDLRDLLSHKPPDIPVVLGGHYTLGCSNKRGQQNQLREIGVDYFVETLEELLPLLDRIAETRDISTPVTEAVCETLQYADAALFQGDVASEAL